MVDDTFDVEAGAPERLPPLRRLGSDCRGPAPPLFVGAVMGLGSLLSEGPTLVRFALLSPLRASTSSV